MIRELIVKLILNMKGVNLANVSEPVIANYLLKAVRAKENETQISKCVFISHKKEDIEACVPIANYLMDAGIDIYFDKYDKTISELVEEGGPDKVTEHLTQKLKISSHMLCVVSPKTIESYWVPFELGYGYHHTVLGILTLKGVSDEKLPEYMKISRVIIRGTKTLNEFISELLGEEQESLASKGLIKKHYMQYHPLDRVLERNQ